MCRNSAVEETSLIVNYIVIKFEAMFRARRTRATIDDRVMGRI